MNNKRKPPQEALLWERSSLPTFQLFPAMCPTLTGWKCFFLLPKAELTLSKLSRHEQKHVRAWSCVKCVQPLLRAGLNPEAAFLKEVNWGRSQPLVTEVTVVQRLPRDQALSYSASHKGNALHQGDQPQTGPSHAPGRSCDACPPCHTQKKETK